MAGSVEGRVDVPVDHTQQLPRLRRIEGQVRGVQQMIESGRYGVDVAHQIDAVIAALRRVQSDMVKKHINALVTASVTGEMPEDERGRLVDEIGKLITRIV